jgi:hypothetical protein
MMANGMVMIQMKAPIAGTHEVCYLIIWKYIVICDFMYILDSALPSETSSDEASKTPMRNRSFTSRSSSSLSSDDVDLENQPSGARNPLSGSSKKVFPPIPGPTRGNASSNKRNRPPSPRGLGSKENPIDVEGVGSLFESIVIREYVWENILQFTYADIVACR